MRSILIPILTTGTAALMVALTAAGCSKHQIEVAPIQVEPIHMTLDITIRIDRELEESFDFEDRIEQQIEPEAPAATPSAPPVLPPPAPATVPSTQPVAGGAL